MTSKQTCRPANRRSAWKGAATLWVLALAAVALACAEAEPGRQPTVLLAVDGADWKVIERLWSEGRLPHLRALARAGVRATLQTFAAQSPVIWTTVATGVTPEVHGITDFVVATPTGNTPVSSALRRVPAIWTMLSAAERRVAVLGWWPSWPAERINGIMVTERALLDLEDSVYPADWLPTFRQSLAAVQTRPEAPEIDHRDPVMAHWGIQLADEDFDLILVYLRSVDLACHRYWKFFRPQRFPDLSREELEEHRDRIPSAYEFVDQTLGAIRAEAPEANVFVVSDHGFKGLPREITRVVLDLDRVLEKLGYLEYSADGVNLGRTRVFTYATANFHEIKRVRFALAGREPDGTVQPEERDEIRRRLTADLAEVRWASGGSVFRVRDVRRTRERGGDFVVEVHKRSATPEIYWRDRPIEGAIESVSYLSGTHDRHTPGIFLAAGPDIRRAGRIDGIRVHDITPTLLYGLGLPVAEDAAGRAWTEVYRAGFRRRHPLQTIASWGRRENPQAVSSAADEKLIEELRALGYLD